LQSVSINAETLAQRDVVDFASVLKLPEVKAERLMVRGSPVLFEQLGKLLSALLGKAGNGGASFVVAKVEATAQLSLAQLSFRCSVPAEFPAIESSSFTRLFFAAAPIDAVEPMLIDALVAHLGGALSLCLKGGILRGDLRFPLEGA